MPVPKKDSESENKLSVPDYMKGFDVSNIEKALEIKSLPTISIPTIEGIENKMTLIVLSRPEFIQFEHKKEFNDSGYVMRVKNEQNSLCQIWLNDTFRFNFGLLDISLANNGKTIIGKSIDVYREKGKLNGREQLITKVVLTN